MFVDEIFNCYQHMYDSISDDEWKHIAELYGLSANDLKTTFAIKDGEYDILKEFINEWCDNYPLLGDFFDRTGDEHLLESTNIKEMFFSAMGNYIEEEGTETLMEHEEFWTCILAEGLIYALYEMILKEISP